MEATGRDDGCLGPWRYGTNSSGTSGTVSSGYTSTSSRLSWMSMEAARHFQEMEMEDTVSLEMEAIMDFEFVQSPKETASEKKMKRIKILAKEFFGAPSWKCSTKGGNLSVLERWFTELGVGWVLHVTDGAPAGHALDASSWFPALTEIVDTFRLTSGHGSTEEEEHAKESEEQNMAEHLQLASFVQQAMLKMLNFVDFIVAPNLICQVVFVADGVPVPAPCEKLHNLLRVHEALSQARSEIRHEALTPVLNESPLALDSSSSTKVAMILGWIVNVLSAKEGKVRGAIWSEMEEIRTRILESLEDGQGSSDTQTPRESSDIDKVTTSVMIYVTFLKRKYWLVAPIVSEAATVGKYVPRFGAVEPLISLELEMVSCLEEKLANMSEAFPDQGLRFLFLLNNSSFIADQLHQYAPYFPKTYKVDLVGKVESYMEKFIQVSWARVLSWLFSSACFGHIYYPLHKFESEFQKMYTTQKLWKVPDPNLRNWLRRRIIDEVIPVYTRYRAVDYRNADHKFNPSYLQEMLQELFEG